MKLLVQKFLETKTFADLEKQHGVYCRFSNSGHKFSLNYDTIEAKESDPLAQECRGLVLAKHDGSIMDATIDSKGKPSRGNVCPGETTILAYPMHRFFNAQQSSAAQVNWNDPKLEVLEKLDGTCIIVYFDHFTNQWCAATRAVCEADLLMDNGLMTFRQLFEKALFETTSLSFDDFTSNLKTAFTYCFELTSPLNKVVCSYPDYKVTLIAVRNVTTHLEMDPKSCNIVTLGMVPVAKSYQNRTLEEIMEWVSALNPLEYEGVIVKDSNFNRIKVKNPAYLSFNRLHDTLGKSPRNCLELILLEKDDDAISFLPYEIADNLTSIKQKYKIWLEKEEIRYSAVYYEAKSIMPNDKKTFALTMNKYGNVFKAAYFNIFDGKSTSIKDFIQKSKKDGTWTNSFLDGILSVIS
mgnify:CR=1 FL=1